MKSLVRLTNVGGDVFLVEQLERRVDPGFGGGFVPVDPGYGQGGGFHPDQDLPWGPGHPGNRPPGSGGGRPDNSLPVAPVRPSPPIVLPPIGTWPPQIPNLPDNSLPPGRPDRPEQPIVIPPDHDLGIEQPIYLPTLPAGSALIIALTGAHAPMPKDVPAGHKPAILYQGAGTKPVLVYVSAAATPK